MKYIDTAGKRGHITIGHKLKRDLAFREVTIDRDDFLTPGFIGYFNEIITPRLAPSVKDHS